METTIYGSLVLSATTPIKDFPIFANTKTKNGNHTESKYRGLFSTLVLGSGLAENNVALPQRNKYMMTSVLADQPSPLLSNHISGVLCRSLTDLDSRFDGARQLYKMQQLMIEVSYGIGTNSYVAMINNVSEHASFNLLACKTSLQIIGVYDTVNTSVRLVWTNDPDFVQNLKEEDYTRYVFYRFPDLYDRPLFIYTQSVCAKWFSWSKVFTGTDGILKTFNALENFLYKDPELAQLDRIQKQR